ncbi:MAG TPA: phage integrase SAM-like domain-containing protein [bacterium]|nr:phage integrase SAM-like domain-containing protein [bacterium]
MDYIFSKYSDKIEINAITPKMIIDFISGQSKQFAPKTVNNRIVYIRELFKFAVDMQIIKESPVIVKFVKEKKTIPQNITHPKILKICLPRRGIRIIILL